MSLTIQKHFEPVRDSVVLDNVVFDDQENTFCLRSNLDANVDIKIIYPLKPLQDYEAGDFDLYLFKNQFYAEDHIFQVYEKALDTRIGWMFPLQALISDSHSHSGNDHFLKYAFVAFNKLCKNDNSLGKKEPLYVGEPFFSLFDFYEEDDIALIVAKEKTREITNFNIDNYLACLYRYGYCYTRETDGDKLCTNPHDDLYKALSTRLNITAICPKLAPEVYITDLFKKSLLTKQHCLVRFMLLYQVIEIGIDMVFQKEFDSGLQEYDKSKSDKFALYKFRERMTDLASEKKRIHKIFNEYFSDNINGEILKDYCNKLLLEAGIKAENDFTDSLYKVRNLLVHGYRSISTKMVETIEDINNEFEKIIVSVLLYFDIDKS